MNTILIIISSYQIRNTNDIYKLKHKKNKTGNILHIFTAMEIELETPQVINFFPTAGNFLSIIAVKSTTCITVLHWHGGQHPELTQAIVGIWNKHPGYRDLDVHWPEAFVTCAATGEFNLYWAHS